MDEKSIKKRQLKGQRRGPEEFLTSMKLEKIT